MLTKSQKEEVIDKLEEAMDQNKILVMADFRGLTVKDISDLKKEVKSIGGRMRVAKKTLLNIVLRKRGIDFDTRQFSGPLTFVFGPEETSIPKSLRAFAKKNEHLKIEGAVLDGKILSSQEVEDLAKLPTREELLAKLVGTVQGPISGLVRTMSGVIGSFVNVVKAVSDKKAKA